MKIVLIANPHSGQAKAKKFIAVVEKKLKANRIRFDLFLTGYHEHAIEIVRQVSVREYDAVVSMGGDGTNYQVLNGLLKYHGEGDLPPLGIIPIGRGNSFCKDLQLFNIEDGISALSRCTVKEVDVCCFAQKSEVYYFVNLMGMGFVTDVAKTAAIFRWAGDFSYVIGVLYHTLGLKYHQMMLEIDGEAVSGANCFVEICNSRYTGGDMLMAPDAEIDDGLFDAVIVSPLGRISLISTFPKIFKGTHGENPAVRFVRGKSAKIYTVPEKALLPDGEMFGTTPTRVDVLPRIVRYFSLGI
ncbi:MAG: diacylglycerol kinase family lipid kinase [Deltaproteobacteria bacterium]|nr:MAG: diacylglycerol kinase family lipid kinase [Deltaproteobacteria bacterium]